MQAKALTNAFIVMGLSACMGAVLSGGLLAVLGGVGLIGMAAVGFQVLKKEAEIEPEYQIPPVRWEAPAQEDGYHWQQTVAEGRGAGRER